MTKEEREEAISYIKLYRRLDENLHNIAPKNSISYYATDKCLKYWDMAIQALSQELCEWGKMTFDAISGMSIFEFSDGTVKRVKQAELEPCEDAISRDAVIKIIEDAETARLRGDIDLLYAPILKKLNELTSVNPQPCDDAISRILKRMWNCRGKHTTSIDKVAMEQIIRDELPSVTQKSGKWIRVTDKAGHLVWECDKCGWQQRYNTNFCPDCGARMESEDKG